MTLLALAAGVALGFILGIRYMGRKFADPRVREEVVRRIVKHFGDDR